ncbi:MAG: hypothetical protein EKK51_00200 [Mycolicibacterium sp.]|uniref:hypothetical protein n=1 Tax=Mycolicibacterium sp. TaxID=2320850 RepID=UPI000FAEF1E0|nr:hypothetical protein [Mycolicibacterium sp.]RUP35014.1 MAG: hypothetical protein EKK51_00200 [Mycolicibacterium sp.]
MTENIINYVAHHTPWCNNHDAEFTLHTEEEPFCDKQVHCTVLIPPEGVKRERFWVYANQAFTHGRFTVEEYLAREARYGGVQLLLDQWVGKGGVNEDRSFRMTSSEARSLAAALIRAADIQQGLDR